MAIDSNTKRRCIMKMGGNVGEYMPLADGTLANSFDRGMILHYYKPGASTGGTSYYYRLLHWKRRRD